MKNPEQARWAVTLLVLAGAAVWFFGWRPSTPAPEDVALPSEPPALPRTPARGRDQVEEGLEPVYWGVRTRSEVLAELERRLAEHGEATVELDPDYPTAITDAAYGAEVDALAEDLNGPVRSRSGTLAFVRILARNDTGGG